MINFCVCVIVFFLQIFVLKIKNFALKFSMPNDVREMNIYVRELGQ